MNKMEQCSTLYLQNMTLHQIILYGTAFVRIRLAFLFPLIIGYPATAFIAHIGRFLWCCNGNRIEGRQLQNVLFCIKLFLSPHPIYKCAFDWNFICSCLLQWLLEGKTGTSFWGSYKYGGSASIRVVHGCAYTSSFWLQMALQLYKFIIFNNVFNYQSNKLCFCLCIKTRCFYNL